MLQTDHQYYKAVMSAIGRTMLIFLLFFNIYAVGISFLAIVLDFLPIGEVAYNVIYQLVYAAGYMISFMLPDFTFSIIFSIIASEVVVGGISVISMQF